MKKIPKEYVRKILEDEDLKKNDLRVLLYLCQILSSKQIREFKNKTVREYLNIDKATIRSSLKLLREHGFIIRHNDKCNMFEIGYTLNFDELLENKMYDDDEYEEYEEDEIYDN